MQVLSSSPSLSPRLQRSPSTSSPRLHQPRRPSNASPSLVRTESSSSTRSPSLVAYSRRPSRNSVSASSSRPAQPSPLTSPPPPPPPPAAPRAVTSYKDAATQYSPMSPIARATTQSDGSELQALTAPAKPRVSQADPPRRSSTSATTSASAAAAAAAKSHPPRLEAPVATRAPPPPDGPAPSSIAACTASAEHEMAQGALAASILPEHSLKGRLTVGKRHPDDAQEASTSRRKPSIASMPSKRVRSGKTEVKVLPDRYEECLAEDLVVLIADMLSELMETNDRLPLRDGVLTRFHSRAPPGISVLDYLQRLAKHATLTPPLLLSMVYYIDRLCSLYPAFTINTLTVHRFLITAATVAAKGLSDSFWNNSTYARVGGLKIAELGLLELEFLYRVDWRIVPNPEVLVDYYLALVERSDKHMLEGETERMAAGSASGDGEGAVSTSGSSSLTDSAPDGAS